MTGVLRVNRTQLLVLGFFALAWLTLAVIVALSPTVRDESVRRAP